jgi:hypothetical protein
MPYHWVRIASSDPDERRKEVKEAVEGYEAKLVGEEIYFDQDGQAYALIDWGRDIADDELEKLLGESEVRGTSWKGLVGVDERVGKKNPPKSKTRDLQS